MTDPGEAMECRPKKVTGWFSNFGFFLKKSMSEPPLACPELVHWISSEFVNAGTWAGAEIQDKPGPFCVRSVANVNAHLLLQMHWYMQVNTSMQV